MIDVKIKPVDYSEFIEILDPTRSGGRGASSWCIARTKKEISILSYCGKYRVVLQAGTYIHSWQNSPDKMHHIGFGETSTQSDTMFCATSGNADYIRQYSTKERTLVEGVLRMLEGIGYYLGGSLSDLEDTLRYYNRAKLTAINVGFRYPGVSEGSKRIELDWSENPSPVKLLNKVFGHIIKVEVL